MISSNPEMNFDNIANKSAAAAGLFKWVISIVGEELVEEPREVLAVAPAQAPIAPVTVKAKKRASQSPQKKSQFTGDIQELKALSAPPQGVCDLICIVNFMLTGKQAPFSEAKSLLKNPSLLA